MHAALVARIMSDPTIYEILTFDELASRVPNRWSARERSGLRLLVERLLARHLGLQVVDMLRTVKKASFISLPRRRRW